MSTWGIPDICLIFLSPRIPPFPLEPGLELWGYMALGASSTFDVLQTPYWLRTGHVTRFRVSGMLWDFCWENQETEASLSHWEQAELPPVPYRLGAWSSQTAENDVDAAEGRAQRRESKPSCCCWSHLIKPHLKADPLLNFTVLRANKLSFKLRQFVTHLQLNKS